MGCYLLAAWIFFFSLYRDYCYMVLLEDQPTVQLPYTEVVRLFAAFLFATGSFLVGASYLQLGVTGTYLGDYFGILMTERVTGFPFNVLSNPMYDGSSLIFLSHAIYHHSPAGVIVSAFVYAVYRLALMLEEPFTAHIYTAAAAQSKRK